MNKLIEPGDNDTVEVWSEEIDKDHKLAFLKRTHDTSRDFVLYNNDKGERYTYEDGEWKVKLSADNPTEADPEYIKNRKAAAERAHVEVEKQLEEIAADPRNELHELHYGLSEQDFAELQPIQDVENYKPEPGEMLESVECPNPNVSGVPLDFPVNT